MGKNISSFLITVIIVPLLFVGLNFSIIAHAESHKTRTVRPGSCPNPFRLSKQISNTRGELSVVIFGTKYFDVMTIDPDSIRLTRVGLTGGGVAPVSYKYEDVATAFKGEDCNCNDPTVDGIPDLILTFNREELASELNLYDAVGQIISFTIKGNLYKKYNGTAIQGLLRYTVTT